MGFFELFYCQKRLRLAALIIALACMPAAADVDLSQLSSKPNPRLGLSFPGSKTQYYPFIAQAGIGVVRISASWERLEPKPGRFDFSGLDSRIIALQNLGIAPFVTFESNSKWATVKKTQKVKNATPKDPTQWQAFVRRVVERYDGDGKADAPGLRTGIRYWQVANEWISDRNRSGGWVGDAQGLIQYVTLAHDAVMAADPKAIFVMGGIAAFNADILLVAKDNRSLDVQQTWSKSSKTVLSIAEMRGPQIGAIIENKVLPVLRRAPFDIGAVHLYGPEARDMARLAHMKRMTGRPVVSSECGGPTLDYGGKYSPEAHFRAVVERNLNVFAANAQFCLWFRLGESGGSTFGNQRTALYDTSKKPKPGVFAYRALARLMDARAKVTFQRPGSFLIRRGAGQKIAVGWGPEAAKLQANSEMLCLADPKKGLMTTDPKKCNPAAMTFAGAGLLSLFEES